MLKRLRERRPSLVHIPCTPKAAQPREIRQSSEMSSGTPNERNRIFHEAATELTIICQDIQASFRTRQLSENSQRLLQVAVQKIEEAARLLDSSGGCAKPIDLENPCRKLPICSRSGCEQAAGAIVNGQLYCGEHASEALLAEGLPAAKALARRQA